MNFATPPASDIREVQFYFVDDKTPFVDFVSTFGSQNYELIDIEEGAPGEQPGLRPWQGGLPSQPVGYPGPCGTAEQWRYGYVPGVDPVPDAYPGTSVPVCCSAPEISIGGVRVGSITGGPSPCVCPEPLPNFFTLTGGFVFPGPCSGFTGAVVPMFTSSAINPNPLVAHMIGLSPPFTIHGTPLRLIFGCLTIGAPYAVLVTSADMVMTYASGFVSVVGSCASGHWGGTILVVGIPGCGGFNWHVDVRS